MNPQVPVQIPIQVPVPQAPDVRGEFGGEGREGALASITVSSRIPEFWVDQPRLWFVQFQAAVENQRLSDAAKQNLVVTKLPKSALQQVSDILLSPPETEKYKTLKERLLQVYEESETRQFQKLLSEMELGTQKPSQLLRRMRDLARGKMPDQTLQIMWNSHLPSAMQAVLAVTEVKDLENLAIVADKVMEATRPPEISEVASASSPKVESSELASTVARLSIEVAELRRSQQTHRGRAIYKGDRSFRSGSRSREASRGRRDPRWLCYYHHRFGVKAAKCAQPCNWKGKLPTPSEN